MLSRTGSQKCYFMRTVPTNIASLHLLVLRDFVLLIEELLLPCASSLAVVMMTGMTPSMISIIRFILIYVLGIALILFLIVLTFNFTKNIVVEKISTLKFNINQELLSGCLILAVGFIYLTYNFVGHSH